jgi:heme/copper-type cytochrome/quinol oxidase subunit 2
MLFHSTNRSLSKVNGSLCFVGLRQVFIGFAQYHCTCLKYHNGTSVVGLIIGLAVGIGGAVVIVIVTGIVVWCCVVCRRRNRKRRQAAKVYSNSLPETEFERDTDVDG